jgi:EpsI family protein
MSELGRRSLTNPILALVENVVDDVTAHLRKYWALWLALAAAALAAGVGMHVGIIRLGTRWNFPYNHSYLVLGMSAWMLARALRAAPDQIIRPSPIGLSAVVVVVLMYELSEVLDVSLGMQVSLPLLLLAVIVALTGLRFARLAIIPVAFLYFAIPIWDLTIVPLQKITVAVVSFAVKWTGLPAFTVGNVITIPAGTFEIAEGCSGMRYFMVSLALAAFCGLTWYGRWHTRFLLLGVAALAAMFANWIRIYTLILIGQATDMQHYVIATSHDGYGWVVFVVCMAPVLWFARTLDKREPADSHVATAVHGRFTVAPAASLLFFGLLVAGVIASPALLRTPYAAITASPDVSLLPDDAFGWRQITAARTWQPDYRSPYFALREGFVSGDGAQVDLYVARYLRQGPDSKLISAHNKLTPGWQVVARSDRLVSIGDEPRRIVQSEIVADGERRLLWHWYIVGGKSTHDRVRAKLLEVLALVRGRRDGAVVAVSAACAVRCDVAESSMTKLLAVSGRWLETVAAGGADQGSGEK